ncbi:MAG: UvrD-helicase domain-containing protein [Clostridia bacterium]|nr:UvrD-helicase domain-containing protein [Clostridia bacterium]
MADNFTKSQKLAIDNRNVSMLLSAAAGSGKTYTLTKRIIAALKEHDIGISDMLIVTFTRAAASELRERISKAVNEALAEDSSEKWMLEQSIAVGSTDICTIDSFYVNIVKSNFQHLTFESGAPLSPDFRMADSDETDSLAAAIMDDVINDFYENNDENFAFNKLADNFSDSRGEGNLVKLLIDHAKFLDGLIDPDGFYKKLLKRVAEDKTKPFFETDYGKMIKEDLAQFVEYAKKVCVAASNYFSGINEKTKKAFESDFAFFERISEALKIDYESVSAVINGNSWERSGNRAKEFDINENVFVDARNDYKDQIKKYKENYFSAKESDIALLYEKLEQNLKVLAEVMREFRAKFANEKANRKICTFNDVSRLAYRLLVNADKTPTPYALSLRDRYKAVYIDEYQDVNELQDDIFKAISTENNLFVVGDIKQSIYKFRGSEPEIFNKMRNALPPFDENGARNLSAYSIFMSENFRCDKNIIDFVNRVSRETFVKANGSVSYRNEDDLIFAKTENVGNAPVTVAAFPAAKKEDDPETLYIADEIDRLLKDGKKNDNNKIVPSDIAVLASSAKQCEEIADALTARGISVCNSSESDFFMVPEVALINAFLTAIDNPSKDIPLASVMRSPLFDFSMDELIRIRIATDTSHSLFSACEFYADVPDDPELAEKCGKFVEKMTELRLSSRGVPVDRFLRKLYREFGITSLADRTRPQKQVEMNLRCFYDMARTFSKNRGGGLSAFIKHVANCIETEKKVALPPVVGGDGAVSVMTIHKSKGLEFPVVFVAFCGNSFSDKSIKGDILKDRERVVFNFKDHETLSKIVSPFTSAMKQKIKKDEIEERMRVLYVALTRAKERLYVTGATSASKDIDTMIDSAAIASGFGTRYSALSANKFFDWIIPALKGNDTVKLVKSYEPQAVEEKTVEESAPILQEYDETLLKTIKDRFDFVYPHIASDVIPAKLSVSSLYPEVLDQGVAELEEKPQKLLQKPLFLQNDEEKNQTSAAERGTFTHLFLQFCDFAAAERDLDNEIARLTAEKFIPASAASQIKKYQLKKFFESEFFKSLKTAKNLYREQRFNLLLPASEFTGDPDTAKALDGETLLVQGVIDLFFVDGDGKLVLCDYKTDFMTDEEIGNVELARAKLTERHATQLRYYAKAIENIVGRAPDKICIYSLPLGREVDIKI